MVSQKIDNQLKSSPTIMSEISDITRQVRQFSPIISILGSARIEVSDPLYLLTKRLAQRLSIQGYTIMTGAGHGLMRAANQGAQLGGSASIGLMVDGFFDKRVNPFLDSCFYLTDVALRKQAFIRCSTAIICLPGGLGTLDELSEILLSYQEFPAQKTPLLLVDPVFWSPIMEWLAQKMLSRGLIDAIDLTTIHVLNSIDDIVDLLIAIDTP